MDRKLLEELLQRLEEILERRLREEGNTGFSQWLSKRSDEELLERVEGLVVAEPIGPLVTLTEFVRRVVRSSE